MVLWQRVLKQYGSGADDWLHGRWWGRLVCIVVCAASGAMAGCSHHCHRYCHVLHAPCFVVVVSTIIIGSVCGVAGFIGMVIAVMVVVWVVGRAIIVVLFAFVVGFNVVGFGRDVNSMAVVHCHLWQWLFLCV